MPFGGWVVFLNGSYGVGKSATLDHCGDLLAAAAVPFSLLDVDWLHRSWPPGVDDPANVLVEARNLAAVWTNYRSVGPRQLVVSGVIASAADRARYETAFGLSVRSVRLEAGRDVTQARLRGRYSPDQTAALTWHLERYADLGGRLADADLDELVIATDELSPREVAQQILDHFGLLISR